MADQIRDVLEVDVNQEIKQVIDVEHAEEAEIQNEIGNYIVTDQLARHFQDLFDALEQDLEETGIWLSGFYGSGKSYFAKIFGYLLRNPSIQGTSAHDRFSRRLEGLQEKEFLEQSLGQVRNEDWDVVMLDLTKQGQGNKGLAWILYENFLSELGFMDTKYGLIEFDLFLEGDYEQFTEAVERETGESWDDLKLSRGRSPAAMREALESEFPDSHGSDVDRYYNDVDDLMNDFGADDLKSELKRYFDKYPDRNVMFITDEVSQSVSDEKIDLSDLEGVQESLSAVGSSKVWLLATAQEKLQDILDREGISKNELSKISDRFKTKVHISGEEVNKVVEERLLKKTETGQDTLEEFYEDHEGDIADLTNLQNCELPKTRTDNVEDFVTYYPFHPYQLELLKVFLFKVHDKATGDQVPRGLITVLDRVIKEIADEDLFRMATASELGRLGDKFPTTAVKRRFREAAEHVNDGVINGRDIMQATKFFTESGKVTPDIEDITKGCLPETGKYYDLKSDFTEAISTLEKNSLLIKKDGYSVATELEEQLIEEMKEEDVGVNMRRRVLYEEIDQTPLFDPFNTIEMDEQHYQVAVKNHAGDLIAGRSEAEIVLELPDIYDIGREDFQDAVDDLKYEHQDDQSLLIVPRTSNFSKMDELIIKIYRYKIIHDRYGTDSDEDKRRIAQEMQEERENARRDLRHILKTAFHNGVLIRDFDEHELSPENFKQLIKDQLKTVADNLYTKRLSHHLDEGLAEKILNEENEERLSTYFDADEFDFFDEGGNFKGEGLPTVEEIKERASDIQVDGQELEDDLTDPPYGWEHGDIRVTLAALMRAGYLKVKFEGMEELDFRNEKVKTVFSNARKFRQAQFQYVQVDLSATQKRDLVDAIQEMDEGRYAASDLDHSSADIHVVKQIPDMAEGYLEDLDSLERSLGDFADECPELETIRNQLETYENRTITENTYKDVAQDFLDDQESVRDNLDRLRELQTFQENNLDDLRRIRQFVEDLEPQLIKIDDDEKQSELEDLADRFRKKDENPVENFSELQSTFQELKDAYHQVLEPSHQTMSDEYSDLKDELDAIRDKAQEAGEDVNRGLIAELNDQLSDVDSYICKDLSLTTDVTCTNCQYDLRSITMALDNLDNIRDKFFDYRERIETSEEEDSSEEEDEETPSTETYEVTIQDDSMTVSEFRQFLKQKLEWVRDKNPDDQIELEVKIKETAN